MKYWLHTLKNWKSFKGRASRTEWIFSFVLICVFYFLLACPIWYVYFNKPELLDNTWFLMGLGFVAMACLWFWLITLFALWTRRLHDVNKSGLYIWLCGIPPILGAIIPLYFAFRPSASGPNRFGEEPQY